MIKAPFEGHCVWECASQRWSKHYFCYSVDAVCSCFMGHRIGNNILRILFHLENFHWKFLCILLYTNIFSRHSRRDPRRRGSPWNIVCGIDRCARNGQVQGGAVGGRGHRLVFWTAVKWVWNSNMKSPLVIVLPRFLSWNQRCWEINSLAWVALKTSSHRVKKGKLIKRSSQTKHIS